jgi:hypothetical protein
MKKASSDASFLPANNILLQQCGVSDLERCLVSSAADDDDACQRRCLRDDDGEEKKSELWNVILETKTVRESLLI